MHESYLSQIRRKTLSKLVVFTRMVGTSANERIIMESKLIMKYFLKNKHKNIKKICKSLVCQSIIYITRLNDFVTKCSLFIKHSRIFYVLISLKLKSHNDSKKMENFTTEEDFL